MLFQNLYPIPKKFLLILSLLFGSVLSSECADASMAIPEVEVRLHRVVGFESPECQNKLTQALELIEEVLSSEEFRNEIISYEWRGRKQFAQAEHLSNEQIYETLIQGVEILDRSQNPALGTIDLDLEVYRPFYRWSKVIGYTHPDANTIYLNRYRLLSHSAEEVAANLVHEWTHKLGFDHDHRRTARRGHSVPYAVGDIFLKIATQQSGK